MFNIMDLPLFNKGIEKQIDYLTHKISYGFIGDIGSQ